MELANRVAVITGGAVRIGREIALALAGQGVRIVVHYHSSVDQAEQTAAEIRSRGGDVTLVEADFEQSTEAAGKVLGAAVSTFGNVDFLINSAAIFQEGTLKTTSEAEWDRHLNINLKTPTFLAQALVAQQAVAQPNEYLRRHIVNLVDWRALRPPSGHLAYTLSKAGLVTLTELLAAELAPQVQVNAIALGAILPPPGKDAAHLQRLADSIPLQRTGSPADVVDALLYLLKSDFVTGTILPVDGGEHL